MIATAISTYRTLWRYLLKFYSQESNPALLMTCTKREASRLPSEDKGAGRQKRTYRTRTSRGQAGSLPQSHGTSISRRTPRGGKSRSLPAQNTNGGTGITIWILMPRELCKQYIHPNSDGQEPSLLWRNRHSPTILRFQENAKGYPHQIHE